MPDFNVTELTSWLRQGPYSWSQQQVDTIAAYLFHRGWRPPISYASARLIRNVSYTPANYQPQPENTIQISAARFKEPLTGCFKGASSALKAALKSETHTNILKQKVSETITLLTKGDVIRAMDLLSEIKMIVGG